jgi:hypothetical protein
VLLQIIILHPATLNSSRLFRFIELLRSILGARLFGQSPAPPRDLEQNQNSLAMGDPFQWLLPLAPHALQKRHFHPGFCSNPSYFWAIFNQFLRIFMTPSKIDLPQNKLVRSVFLPEKGTPPPPPYLL